MADSFALGLVLLVEEMQDRKLDRAQVPVITEFDARVWSRSLEWLLDGRRQVPLILLNIP